MPAGPEAALNVVHIAGVSARRERKGHFLVIFCIFIHMYIYMGSGKVGAFFGFPFFF